MESDTGREPLLDSSIRSSVPKLNAKRRFSLSRIGWYCLLLNLLCGLSESLLSSPLLALYEQSLCISYYDSHLELIASLSMKGLARDSRCKILPIQQDLATIRGWKSLFDAVPALLFAIPFGRMADRVGRRKVYLLSLLGSISALSWELIICRYPHRFSLRWIWFSSLLQCIGGGAATSDIMLMAMAADSCEPRHRTQTLSYVYVAFVLAEIIGPVAASVLMRSSLWIPSLIAIALLILSMTVVVLMPESWQHGPRSTVQSSSESTPDETQSVDVSGQSARIRAVSTTPSSYTYTPEPPGDLHYLLQKHVILVLPLFLVFTLRYILLGILVQYSSARFGWDIADSGIFQSEVAIVGLIQYVFLLPALMRYLRSKPRAGPKEIDLKIVIYSVSCLCIGSFCIGLCSIGWFLILAVLLFALGFGIRAPLLSFLSLHVPESSRGILFSTTTLVANLGQLVCSPIWGYIYAWSGGLPAWWQGMPFYMGGVAFGLAGACTLFVVN